MLVDVSGLIDSQNGQILGNTEQPWHSHSLWVSELGIFPALRILNIHSETSVCTEAEVEVFARNWLPTGALESLFFYHQGEHQASFRRMRFGDGHIVRIGDRHSKLQE